MTSIFTDKNIIPSVKDLKKALGDTFFVWEALAEYAKKAYPKAAEEWSYSGPKYGWNFKIKDKKRAILYLLPRDGFFKAAFVFGQKATDAIMRSDVSGIIKSEIQNAKVYAEGRGIRIAVTNDSITEDLKKLITIKVLN